MVFRIFRWELTIFQGEKYGESGDVENLLVERLGGGVARLNDYKERGCI